MFRIHLMIIACSLSHIACVASEDLHMTSYARLLQEELVAWIKYEINQADTEDDRMKYQDMIERYYYSHFDQITEELEEIIRNS